MKQIVPGVVNIFLALLFLMSAPLLAEDTFPVTGCLYNENLQSFGLSDFDVNPFYAFWYVRCYDFDGNTYQAQLDARGCFSIEIPDRNRPYFIVFLNQQGTFQAGLCFPEYGKGHHNAYYAFTAGTRDTIDLGRLLMQGAAAVPDAAVQQSMAQTVDIHHAAYDVDNDGIPDGFDNERASRRFEGVLNMTGDLDNDGIPDEYDIDTDGDAIPDDLDDDVDADGFSNEHDDDATNDGIIDSLGPVAPHGMIGDLPDELSGTVEIPLTLVDDNGDRVDLTVRFSTDSGASYRQPTLIESGLSGLAAHPVGIEHMIIWDTRADFGSADVDGVWLELRLSDGELTGEPVVLKNIAIRNNHEPVVTFESPKAHTSYTGTVAVAWKTDDIDTDQELQVYGLWLTFDQENYILLSADLSPTGSFVWNSDHLGYQQGCHLVIAVTDGYADVSVSTGPFSLDGEPFMEGLRFVSPSQDDQQLSGIVSLAWDDGDDSIHYDLSVSTDGFNWQPLVSDLKGRAWNWDVSGYPNTADVRLMLTATDDRGYVAYAFSPVFIIKNENNAPELILHEPDNTGYFSEQMRIAWQSSDPDPGDTVESVTIAYSSPETSQKVQVDKLDNDPGEYLWDISQLPDMKGYTVYVTVSDGETETTRQSDSLRIDNPPSLVKINQRDSQTIEMVFSENVNNVYQSITFSDGAMLKALRRLAPAHYILTTTPLASDMTYTMVFHDTITDDSGQHMRTISVPLSGVADTDAPRLRKPITSIDETHIDILFTEVVLHADKPGAYRISPSLTVRSVVRLMDGAYRLATGRQEPGTEYTVSFDGITDLAGNKLVTGRKKLMFTGFSSDKIIRVDPRGNGDVSDLAMALNDAPAGSYIKLAAGLYEHGLHINIDTHVTVHGGFDPSTWQPVPGLQSVVTTPATQAAVTSAGISRLINLHVTNSVTGVNIYNGHCVMHNCYVFGNDETGIYVSHRASAAIIGCAIYENKNFGIGLYTDHQSVILNSVIHNNENHGIMISTGGDIVVANCIISENVYGVFLQKCKKDIPVITHNCFFRNNRAQSLDSSYAVLDSCGDMLYVINDADRLNQPDRNWIGNTVTNPQLEDSFVSKNPVLHGKGTDAYSYLFDLLPGSVAPGDGFSFPVGRMSNRLQDK